MIFRITLETVVLKRGVTRLAGHFAMELAKFMKHVHPHVFVFNLLKIKFLKLNKTMNFKLVLYSFTFCFVSDENHVEECYCPVTPAIYLTPAIPWTIAWTIFLYCNHNSWNNCKCECECIVQYILLLKDKFTQSQWLSKSHVWLHPNTVSSDFAVIACAHNGRLALLDELIRSQFP